jgi:hypothetical protein
MRKEFEMALDISKIFENAKKINNLSANFNLNNGTIYNVTKRFQIDVLNQVMQECDFNMYDSCYIAIKKGITTKELFNKLLELGEMLLYHEYSYIILGSNYVLFIESTHSSSQIGIGCHIFTNSFDMFKKVEERIKGVLKEDIFTCPEVSISYYYFEEGKIDVVYTSEIIDDTFLQSSYPFIPNMQEYVQRFIKSSASILLLIGTPGSGKTRFIRYILSQMKKPDKRLSISYTSFKQVIESTKLYKDFMFSDQRILILEDVDYHLAARTDGNYSMYALLNASDGVIAHRDSKIILSTNLSNVTSIDPALFRPGRCFDVLHFRKLTYDESLKFINAPENRRATKPSVLLEEREHSLAELYALMDTANSSTIGSIQNKVGY